MSRENLFQKVKIIIVAIFLAFGISYAYSWSGPTATPPGGNVEAPINVGPVSQIKSGDLGVRSFSASGNVGIGTTNPTARLHIAGTPGADGIRFPDGTLQTTAAAGAGGCAFGGMFNTVRNASRGSVNPLTGGHSCPVGFTALRVATFPDNAGRTHAIFYCMRC